MICANYTTVLYCDCTKCLDNPVVGEFIGNSWTDTVRKAKKHGWRVSKDRTKAFAPDELHTNSI